MNLSDREIHHFRERGYVAPVRVMAPRDVVPYRGAIEEWIDELSDCSQLRTKAHLHCEALMELVRSENVLEPISNLLGPDLLCRSSSIFLKEPGAPSFTPWHQDAVYWDLDPPDVATAWIAIGASTLENGALRVLPRSHREPLLQHGTIPTAGNMLLRGQGVTEPVDEQRVVTLTLEPGEMSIHDVRLAHASGINYSPERRIGFAIRYVASHVRSGRVPRDTAIVVRGQDRYGHFDRDLG